MMMELSLTIAALNYDLDIIGEHIPGVDNKWTDSLSRLAEPGANAAIPEVLLPLPCPVAPPRVAAWWLTERGMAPPTELDLHVQIARKLPTAQTGGVP